MLSPREKSPLPEKFSSEEDRTHIAASSRTASPTTNELFWPVAVNNTRRRQWVIATIVYLKIIHCPFLSVILLVYKYLNYVYVKVNKFLYCFSKVFQTMFRSGK